jgi:hypothetical protein
MCSRWSHHFLHVFLLYRLLCSAVDKRRTKSCCFVQCYVSLDEWRYRQIDDVLRLLQIRRTGGEATTSDCKRTKHRTRYQYGRIQITGRDMGDRCSVVIGRGAGTRGCAFRCWGSDVAHGRLLRQLVMVVRISMVVRVTQRLDCLPTGIIRCPTWSKVCGLADCGCWMRGRLR